MKHTHEHSPLERQPGNGFAAEAKGSYRTPSDLAGRSQKPGEGERRPGPSDLSPRTALLSPWGTRCMSTMTDGHLAELARAHGAQFVTLMAIDPEHCDSLKDTAIGQLTLPALRLRFTMYLW